MTGGVFGSGGPMGLTHAKPGKHSCYLGNSDLRIFLSSREIRYYTDIHTICIISIDISNPELGYLYKLDLGFDSPCEWREIPQKMRS